MSENNSAAIAATVLARLAIDKALGVKFIRCSPATRAALFAQLQGKPADISADVSGKNSGERKSSSAEFSSSRVRLPNKDFVSGGEKTGGDDRVNVSRPATFKPSAPRLIGEADAIFKAENLAAQTAQCRACPLAESRRQTVFGEGSLSAKVMFIADAPGKDDELTGRPAQGESGELLAAIIEKGLKFSRDEVFITQLLKCRPPGNRRAKPTEFTACENFWRAQIALIKPRVIVALGETAAQILTGQFAKIADLRAQTFFYDEKTVIIPTYHPAFLAQMRIRYGGKNDYDRAVWTDIKKIPALLQK